MTTAYILFLVFRTAQGFPGFSVSEMHSLTACQTALSEASRYYSMDLQASKCMTVQMNEKGK